MCWMSADAGSICRGNKISADNFSPDFEGMDFTIQNGTFDAKGGSYALFIGDMRDNR